MNLTKEQVRALAAMARLEVTLEEIEVLTPAINRTFKHIEGMQEVFPENTPPQTNGFRTPRSYGD